MEMVGRPTRDFSKIGDRWAVPIPNLLDVQINSFQKFLQVGIPMEGRKNEGLQEVFNAVFPITDARETYSLEYVGYTLGDPKYSVDECQERDLTFSVPLKVTLRLRVREEVDGVKRDKAIQETEVYLGELPMITEKGTFIINGAERVIVSQLHRSPGVFFDHMVHPNGKKLYSARIIPYRGSWVEFSIDVKDIMYVHIDRKRKLPATVLLKALGIVSDQDILDFFYSKEEEKIPGAQSKKLQALVGRVAAEDIVDTETGEVLLECNEEITEEKLKNLAKAGIDVAPPLRDPAPGRRGHRPQHPEARQLQDRGGGAGEDLRAAAPGRAVPDRERARDPEPAVLQPQAIRPGSRGPLQAEPEAQPQRSSLAARR